MTRQPWATEEQHAWLEQRMPAFLEANQRKSAAKEFFPGIVEEFCKVWPCPPYTQAELNDAAGSKELAARVKQGWYEKHITFWFHNHARTVSSHTGSGHGRNCKMLKMLPKSMPRKFQLWQAYQALTYESRWKPVINREWAEEKLKWERENPGQKLPKGSRMAFMIKFLKEKYEQESEEVKKATQDFRNCRISQPESDDAPGRKDNDYKA